MGCRGTVVATGALRRIILGIPATPVLDAVTTEASSCSGFPADTYDRYVLGLLDGHERANVDKQIEQKCPACIAGVQRSMNLWLVFANSLEQIEPSADFRARLVRIAELSNRVLTIPKRHKRVREPAILISSLVMMSLVLITLLIFTWIAGRQSARLDEQRGNAELQRLTQELAQKQVDEQQQKDHIRALEEKQTSTGPFEVAQQKKLENSLSTALASVEQLKAIINRDGQKTEVNTVLVSALSAPGAKLLTFKNAEGLSSTAYAFIVENSKVIFVASNLAPPADQHQYQLWLVRKDEPRFVSAGLFATLDDKPVVVTYSEDKEAITNLAGLSVTEEPLDGSKEPTGKRVMETSGAAAITALAPSAPEID